MTPVGIILDTLSELAELSDDEKEKGTLNCVSNVIAAFCFDSGMSVPEVRWEIRQRQTTTRTARRRLARLEAKNRSEVPNFQRTQIL